MYFKWETLKRASKLYFKKAAIPIVCISIDVRQILTWLQHGIPLISIHETYCLTEDPDTDEWNKTNVFQLIQIYICGYGCEYGHMVLWPNDWLVKLRPNVTWNIKHHTFDPLSGLVGDLVVEASGGRVEFAAQVGAVRGLGRQVLVELLLVVPGNQTCGKTCRATGI